MALEHAGRALCFRLMDRLNDWRACLLRSRGQLLPQLWSLERRVLAFVVAVCHEWGYSDRRRNEFGDRKGSGGAPTCSSRANMIAWKPLEKGKTHGEIQQNFSGPAQFPEGRGCRCGCP